MVVALSGGADSALAAAMAVEHAMSARAVHVHHGFAGSDDLAAAARLIASQLDLPLTEVEVDPRGSSETAARQVRRAALLESLDTDEFLVTGHTADDQAETVLHRIIRGSGPEGVSGMRADDGRTLRPLLDMGRDDVRALAASRGLGFVDDPENEERRHLRNRIRHEHLPSLAEENPSIVRALGRLARHMPRPADALAFRASSEVARIPLPALAVAHPDVRAETIRRALTRIRPPYPPSTDEVDRVLDVVHNESRRAELDGGHLVIRDRTWLRIGPLPAVPGPIPLADLPVEWGGFAFGVGPTGSTAGMPLGADAGVRAAAPGDRIGMGSGTKPVVDALAEAGVPRELRRCWPVVVEADSVVWIPMIRKDPGFAAGRDGYLSVHARVEEAW